MNFENLPVFDEVMRLRWLTFFGKPCSGHGRGVRLCSQPAGIPEQLESRTSGQTRQRRPDLYIRSVLERNRSVVDGETSLPSHYHWSQLHQRRRQLQRLRS